MIKPASIRDLADLAGVSTATVSHVLSGKQHVRDVTKQKVLDAVEQLGYRRNRSAAALRTGRTDSITVIVPDVTSPFYAEFIAGLGQKVNHLDSSVMLMCSGRSPEREARNLKQAMYSDTGSVIFLPMTSASLDEAATYQGKRGPRLVLADTCSEGLPFSTVSVDNVEASRLVAEHFADIGRERAAVAAAMEGVLAPRTRVDSFRHFARMHGIETRDEWSSYGSPKIVDTVRHMVDVIASNPSIDAFFAGADALAVLVMHGLKGRGVKVPDDVVVCGFDDVPVSFIMTPSLTTIHQPIRKMGYEAARLATDTRDDIEHVVLPVHLVVRESTSGQATFTALEEYGRTRA